jgi:fumarate hydratase subunit beta
MMHELSIPISDDAVRQLRVGDSVSLHGTIITGRDAAHKWLIETFIRHTREPQGDDLETYEAIKPLLNRSAIYHCGPVVAGLETRDYSFVAAGPTTSTREEPYQAEIIRHFNAKAVIGKGGMGLKTLKACQEVPCVYLHAIGGAATLIAQSVKKVLAVYKLEFGVPEAIWVIQVQAFPAVVTMDSHGESLHERVKSQSKEALDRLLA